jgi:hypothetical protein
MSDEDYENPPKQSAKDISETVWPFYPPPRNDDSNEPRPRWLYKRTGDVTREEWEIPFIERVRQLNWTIRKESPRYQQFDAEEIDAFAYKYSAGITFLQANSDTGFTESIKLTEEPTIEKLREMSNILSSSDLGEMWVNCQVEWTGGLPYGFDFRFPEDDCPESQPPGWEIDIEAQGVFEVLPWYYSGDLEMDGCLVYKSETGEIITDEDLADMRECERSQYLKSHDACSFIFSAARESGLVIIEAKVEERLNWMRMQGENPLSDDMANDRDWQAARSKALSGHEPTVL